MCDAWGDLDWISEEKYNLMKEKYNNMPKKKKKLKKKKKKAKAKKLLESSEESMSGHKTSQQKKLPLPRQTSDHDSTS